MRLLLSYWYYKNLDLDEYLGRFPEHPDVFADSGAFTAMTLGAEVVVGEYAAWLRKWQHHLTAAANLDVIGSPEGTAANQQRLEDLGVQVLPVYHARGDWDLRFDVLADLNERYSYVCLGGLVGMSTVMPWLVQAFAIAERTGTRFHGFGQTRTVVLRDLPWYSVDSSSWGSVYRYGGLDLWDHRTCTWVQLRLRDAKAITQHFDLIRSYGERPGFLATAGDRKAPGRVPKLERARLARLSALAWQRYESYLQQRHQVTPPQGWEGGGPRVYLATAEPNTTK